MLRGDLSRHAGFKVAHYPSGVASFLGEPSASSPDRIASGSGFPTGRLFSELGLASAEPKLKTPFLVVVETVIRNLLRFPH